MSQIKWEDFLNILTLKGNDTGVLKRVKSATEDIKKFEICYNANMCYLEEWLSEHIKIESKSHSRSLDFRLSGNKVYQKGKDLEALKFYNSSVTAAPYNTNEFALSLANRSAVLLRLGYNTEAIQDIDLALEHGDDDIPRSKLLIRKSLLLHKLNLFKDTLHLIKTLYPDESKICAQQNIDLKHAYFDSLEKNKNPAGNDLPKQENHLSLPSPKGGESKDFLCASNHVLLKYSKTKGRHVIAKEDLSISDIIFVDKPFALVVLPDQYQNHCHHCCKNIVAYVPCHSCTRALFCSNDCQGQAWSQYHQWECRGLNICHIIGIAHLGLRVSLLADSSDRYRQVFDLVTHIEDMKAEDLYQYTITAALLTLYLEKNTTYFESNPLDVNEMGCRILRHIAHMICNGHAITKIDSTLSEKGCNKTLSEKKVRIATAIYPSASMMNHSCDQNILNSFVNEYLVVRACKLIKKGEEVFNCYGPHYKTMNRDERLKSLQSQYFFTCKCNWCTVSSKDEFYPFSALLCSYCSGPVLENQAVCSECHRSQPLEELVNKALTAQEAFHKGDIFMKEGNSNKALACLEKSVELSNNCLFKHNTDLRTYKDCLARLYTELGRYDESIVLVEECIMSIEKQFGSSSMELCRELFKLRDILALDLSRLKELGLENSKQYRTKTNKIKTILKQTKKIIEGSVDASYLNQIPGMRDVLKCLEEL